MGRQRAGVVGAVLVSVVAGGTLLWAGQLPLAPVGNRGQTVTPVYEGWYANPDGTLSLSFGYFNRNTEEDLYIPIGVDNLMTPGDPNQGQPTHFFPQRQQGVFSVTVPADFGDREIVWTLSFRGETNSIPGHLHRDWMLDSLEGQASGNMTPVLKFDPAGPEGRGPGGVTVGPLSTPVGTPLTLTVWATDDGWTTRQRRADDEEREGPPLVTLTWHKHQGPGEVEFGEAVLPAGKLS